MTIAYYAGKVAIGTAAERAALTTLVAEDVGYHFRESDTGKVYYWTGSAWAEQVVTGVGVGSARIFGETKKYGRYNFSIATLGGNSEGLLNTAPGAVGTVGSIACDTTGIHVPYTTGTTINTPTGLRWTRFTCRALNPWFVFRQKLGSVANVRQGIFISSATVAPLSNAEPLPSLHGAGFWYDSAVNANWRFYTNNGGASSTNADTGIAATTNLTTFEVKAINATPAFQWRINGYPSGSWSADVTATLPASTAFLCITTWIENLTTTSVQIDYYDLQIVQDG